MSLPKDKAWFPLKRYGYGWGFPVRWQGWISIVVYATTMAVAGVVFAKHMGRFVGLAIVETGLFIALCFCKGETPRWRWGDDKKKGTSNDDQV